MAAAANVATVKVVDKRIEPQPSPVYAETIGPVENQYYVIPNSGLSDSYITFNNLTTLGANRAYLDTFELEIDVTIRFNIGSTGTASPKYDMWTFDSFPFNKCCEEARVNINGGAFFSQPLSYLRAKERYWDEKKISDAYTGICPCHKPYLMNENGVSSLVYYDSPSGTADNGNVYNAVQQAAEKSRSRCIAPVTWGLTASGANSSPNNAHVDLYTPVPPREGAFVDIHARWREPVFASPFSSRIDSTYGRPLYNITSMDLAFNMQNLGNMIRCVDPNVTSYTVHINNCRLLFQVMTVPPSLAPPMTVVPYRRFVPYITNAPDPLTRTANPRAANSIQITSGVYTLNEIPTAIWIFAAPVKAALQDNQMDTFTLQKNTGPADYWTLNSPWGFNKTFLNMTHVSISLANTTQILNTAQPEDLFRIAKANGLQDSYYDWRYPCPYTNYNHPYVSDSSQRLNLENGGLISPGVGSVLRLIPGTDITLPNKQLIPGTNANNMVFQVTADFEYSTRPGNFNNYALWLLFEYVGVATISPGQCQISMNPLGSIETLPPSTPVISSAVADEPSTVEGSGIWDKIKTIASDVYNGVVNPFLKKTQLASSLAKYVPVVGSDLVKAAEKMGWGYKRGREDTSGGAMMGLGDFC